MTELSPAPEALFYHLRSGTLERVLPDLVQRTLERGWRAVIRTGSEERVAVLDRLLWTWRDDSFLPHGAGDCPFPADQPVYLTHAAASPAAASPAAASPADASPAAASPNGAEVAFLVDGAGPDGMQGCRRCVFLAVEDDPAHDAMRAHWQAMKDAGRAAVCWRQGDGGWEQQDA